MTASEALSPFENESETLELTPRERRKLILWRIVAIVLPLLIIGLAISANVIMGALKPEPEKKEDVVRK